MNRIAILILPSIAVAGCLSIVPGSRPYTPADTAEKQLLSQARRDVFPDDVRANPDLYRATVVLWSSIVRKVDTSEGNVTVVFEHHYWDFIEDYSARKAIAFLSPRGEGNFKAAFPLGVKVTVGDMALVYGTPDKVESDGTVVLAERSIRTLRQELYATDVWDYGRAFLLKNDMKDFKVLRVPMR